MALATTWNVPPAGPPPKTIRLAAFASKGSVSKPVINARLIAIRPLIGFFMLETSSFTMIIIAIMAFE